jgi:hypothetical protein
VTEDLLVKRKEGLIEAEVDGELVALHVENGTCYGFNGTATRIWQMVEEPKRLSELRDALMAEFDVDAETCEQDVRALVKDLESDGLVEVSAA